MVSTVKLINSKGSGSSIVSSEKTTKEITLTLPSQSGTLALEGGGPSGGVPPGTIVHGAYQTVPEGWLLCDGQSVSTTEYQNLYSAIGNVFGGDATNFNLPDLRGQFIRGWSGPGPSVVDPSRVFGSLQQDAFESHTHTDSGHSHSDAGHAHGDAGHDHPSGSAGASENQNAQPGEGVFSAVPGGGGIGTGYSNIQASAANIQASAANITATGGTETRPVNIALLPIIKF